MKFCDECFSELNKNGTCAECTSEEIHEEKKRKPRSDKWEPNIKPNEKWFPVKSDYKAYEEGLE